MVKKIIFVFAIMLVLPPFASAQTDMSDSLTITTYYPSPYGVYGILRLHPRSRKASCEEGEIFYYNATVDPAERGLYYCNNTHSWVPFGGGMAGYWAENVTSQTVYNTNTGNVGINTDQAVVRLQVNGSAILGSAEGVQNYESESLRIWTNPTYWGPAAALQDALFIEKTDDDPAVEGGMIFGFANSTGWDTHMDSPGWAINHIPVVTLRGTGNVGIGTTNPSAKLDVNGTMKLEPVAAPAGNPPEGTVYYDSTLHTPRYRDQTAQWSNFISEYGSVNVPAGQTTVQVNFRKTYSTAPFVIATVVPPSAPAPIGWDDMIWVRVNELYPSYVIFDIDSWRAASAPTNPNTFQGSANVAVEIDYIVIPQ